MNSFLYIIYSSLFTVFILSSCMLYMLVVSEPITLNEVFNNSDDTVDSRVFTEEQLPVSKEEIDSEVNTDENFAESVSQNSGIADGLLDVGQPKIVIELPKLSDVLESHQENIKEQKLDVIPTHNETAINEQEEDDQLPIIIKIPLANNDLKESGNLNEESISTNITSENKELNNFTEKSAESLKPSEEIPSFSEWAQKQIAEAERKDTINNHSTQTGHQNTASNGKVAKLRTKNYASPACGAKVIAYNSEAGSANSILSQNKDEYMLNTCNSKIWFVVELCEAIQAEKIEIANFELFSSSPKEFLVSLSNRFPSREWTPVGRFEAKDERDIQSFQLFPQIFGKFIKVEMVSHYGSEHYCPITLFKAYGTSEFEVLEKENTQQQSDDDDEILGDLPDIAMAESDHSKNLFGSARDAVISIVKKAAEALGKTDKSKSKQNNESSVYEEYIQCCSPSHILVCNNCSETFYNSVFKLISCNTQVLLKLLKASFIPEYLIKSNICNNYGLKLGNSDNYSHSKEGATFLQSIFPEIYITAFCNLIAIDEGKVVLNTSSSSNNSVLVNLTLDKISKAKLNEKDIAELIDEPFKNSNVDTEIINITKESEYDVDDVSLEPIPSDDINSELIFAKTEEQAVSNEIEATDQVNVDTKEEKEIKNDQDLKETATNNQDKSDIPVPLPETIQTAVPNEIDLNDFDQLLTDPVSTHSPTQSTAHVQAPQSESVFMRLSNRVKALERNMSLSGQYLEELSRRYKKQVEEMQKNFDRTVSQMDEERKKYEEREQKASEEIVSLKSDIALLTIAINTLVEEQHGWLGNVNLLTCVLIQIAILFIYTWYTKRKIPTEEIQLTAAVKKNKSKKTQVKMRRKSVEGVTGHSIPLEKIRWPSEEALQIARLSAEEKNSRENEWAVVSSRSKRRKSSILNKTHPIIEPSNKNWIRQNSIGELKENVIPLDEAEFIAPVSEPKQFNEDLNMKHSPCKDAKGNGSVSNAIQSTAKPVKKRRLSSPAFFKSALSRQNSKNASGSTITNLSETEAVVTGSETSSVRSVSNTSSNQINGRSSSISPHSKKKSIKSIFKKVF